ncbi:MAG: DUF523 domain-containing protein [Sulfuricurvum sp.]|nr:DUF523 domain-containing protein [Sulfuricurvum sp.]
MTYIVSACLLGEACRYDGASKGCEEIIALGKNHSLVPFCPEAPTLGTPRKRISVIEENGKLRLKRDSDGVDITGLIEAFTYRFLEANPYADGVILKSKSPSCGLGTAPIYNAQKELLRYGNGIATECFIKHGMTVVDEHQFKMESMEC